MVTSFLLPSKRVQQIPQCENSAEVTEEKELQKPSKIMRSETVARAMQPIVHELNPLLDFCVVDDRKLQDIPDDDFAKFDVVIASRIPLGEAIRISKATVKFGNKFYLADCFGLDGCAFLDLGPDHLFRKEIGKDMLSDPMKVSNYVPFEKIIRLKLDEIRKSRWENSPPRVFATYKAFLDFEAQTGDWPSPENSAAFIDFLKQWIKVNGMNSSLLGDEENLRSLALKASAEISPVCSVLGGIIGNEVIKALSGKGEPANNVLLFEGLNGGCRSFFVDSS
jgi:ubiquitin-like 1-activating enzyme E1 A